MLGLRERLSIYSGELDGIEATRRNLAAGPAGAGVRIIILTTFDLDEYVYAALTAGASGFLLKDVTPDTCPPPSSSCRPGTLCWPRRS